MFWLFLSFFFSFLPAGCTIYTAASCSGDVGGRGGEGAGSKTTKVKKLGFKQMELNPKVNTWRGKVLRPVPRCLVWVARGPLACHFGARVSRLERRRIIERFRVSDIFSPAPVWFSAGNRPEDNLNEIVIPAFIRNEERNNIYMGK